MIRSRLLSLPRRRDLCEGCARLIWFPKQWLQVEPLRRQATARVDMHALIPRFARLDCCGWFCEAPSRCCLLLIDLLERVHIPQDCEQLTLSLLRFLPLLYEGDRKIGNEITEDPTRELCLPKKKKEVLDAWIGFKRFGVPKGKATGRTHIVWERFTRKQKPTRPHDVRPNTWKHTFDGA